MTETADPHHITAPDEARAAVAALVENYRRNADHYTSAWPRSKRPAATS